MDRHGQTRTDEDRQRKKQKTNETNNERNKQRKKQATKKTNKQRKKQRKQCIITEQCVCVVLAPFLGFWATFLGIGSFNFAVGTSHCGLGLNLGRES
jgi:hypothetical protein